MKRFQKLDRFPLGSIHAEGFLKEQMELGRDGMCGHLHELEPDMIANPYVNKKKVKAWGNGDQDGWGAEISGNYWAGYIQFAYTLNDADMIKTAENWVNAVLKNQKEDGYLGTYTGPDALIYDDYNAWGTSCGMRALIAFYEATKRKDVLEAVYRCMLWFCKNWAGDRKTTYAGMNIIEPMIFTYYYTGDERLIQFSEDYLDFICRNDLYKMSYQSMLSDEFYYHAYHAGAIGTKTRLPALVYTVTGNKDYLKASENFIRKNREKSIQLTGGAVSSTEYNGPVGAVRETEYCCFTTINQAYSYLSYITGNAKYGDFMEEVFYNGAQGARKKDEKAIPYLSAPNQVYATEFSSGVYANQQVYAPCYPVSCCPVNAVAIVPDFIRGMMLHDEADNVYVTAYGPCTLNYMDISITEETYYPFRNQSKFIINCDKEFTLYLKAPEWSLSQTVKVNDKTIDVSVNDDGYIPVFGNWSLGDTVEIFFEAKVKVIQVDDSDGNSKYPIAVKYGALLYSYHISEKWIETEGNPMTKLPDGWSWYNVMPAFEESDVEDAHERLVRRREQYTWNIAVDEHLTSDDFEIEEVDKEGYVWSNPMIKLHTHCYKAPYLNAIYEGKTFEPIGAYQPVTEKLPLTLVPHGCTNLRITYFPKADLRNKVSFF
ncbi:MAG: hypothetical protein E7399_01410 [Ruminococcaceae bacterium]|nr:hypothetical protein [Oscillospiraceae bacterium]